MRGLDVPTDLASVPAEAGNESAIELTERIVSEATEIANRTHVRYPDNYELQRQVVALGKLTAKLAKRVVELLRAK